MEEYLYMDLSKELIGMAFDIFKQIGGCLPEKTYQKAFENKLIAAGYEYKKENYCKIEVDNLRVGHYFLDFVVSKQIVVEFKVRDELWDKDLAQVLTYLRINKLRLGLIFLVTKKGVRVKRLVL